MSTNPVLVTGGAGFIGSNFVLRWIETENSPVVNLDKLTYAGNLKNLESLAGDSLHRFVQGDICDRSLFREILKRHQPWAIIHFAAESHVDRSIRDPDQFIRTNVTGTFHLLEEAREYWESLEAAEQARFRFLHISTDEVYGSLAPDDPPSSETSPYSPNSPYSATKAASDHLVRAYHHTYGFPTLTIHCSNNYGPYQFPEKLIPLVFSNAIQGKPLPVYGDGKNVRDWLFVLDHCDALRTVLTRGRVGETYNIGGSNQTQNLDLVKTVCSLLDALRPNDPVVPHAGLISFVKDRPGHDRRYAIDTSKIERELGWRPRETFESGIRKTLAWYLAHEQWLQDVASGSYREWMARQYSQ
jgi:dTDP-glucose 4,6-dehydratase